MNKKDILLLLLVSMKMTETVDYGDSTIIDQFARVLQTIVKTSKKNIPAVPSRKTFPQKLAEKKHDQLRAVLKSAEGKILNSFLMGKNADAQYLRQSLGDSNKDSSTLWEIFSKSSLYKKPENLLAKFDDDALIKISQALQSGDSDGNLKKFIETIKILNKSLLDFQDQIKVKNFDKQWPFDTVKKIETTKLFSELKNALKKHDITTIIKLFKQVDSAFGAFVEKEKMLQELLLMIKEDAILEALLKDDEIRTIYKKSIKRDTIPYAFIRAAQPPVQEFLVNNPILLKFLLVKDTYPTDEFTDTFYGDMIQRLMNIPPIKKDQLGKSLEYVESQIATLQSSATPSRFLAIQAMKKEFPFRDLSEKETKLEKGQIFFEDLLKDNENAKKLFERKELAAIKNRLFERLELAKKVIECKQCIDIMYGFDKDKLESVATEIEFGMWDDYSAQKIVDALKNIAEW